MPKYLAGLGSHGGIGSDGIGSLELESQQDWGGWVPGVEGDAYLLLKVLLCKHAAKVNKKMVVPLMFMNKNGLDEGFHEVFYGWFLNKKSGVVIGQVKKVNTSRWVGWWLSCEP